LDITPADHDVLLGKAIAVAENDEAPYSPVVIKSKEFQSQSMTKEEAVSHMELVGHDFYLFLDSETSRPAVVYRRKGWNYGVISLI
jgi:hypothetical protein